MVLLPVAAGARQTAKPTNLTGSWTGFLVNAADPNDKDEALLTLKQTGAELSGTGGPTADRQFPLKGKVTTTKAGTTAAFVVDTGTMTLQFDLKLVEGKLTGALKMARDGQERNGTAEFQRSK
jgi:hypothetical protein